MQRPRFFWLPNAISILRLGLVVPYAASFSPAYPLFLKWRLIIAFVIIFADKIDGILARKLRCESRLGSFLDTLADSVFVLVSWLLFYKLGAYPLSFLILLIAPRFVVLGSICALRLFIKKWNIEHLPGDKIGGGVQYFGILWLLAGDVFAISPYATTVLVGVLVINYLGVIFSIFQRAEHLTANDV